MDKTETARSKLSEFRNTIWRFYAEEGRDFPWRQSDDEYEILVSEIMLQQTQTERVLKKFSPFLDRFPDYRSLAEASTSSLLEMWQGLGYNRRALALRRICEIVVDSGGGLPSDEKALLSLPGIGPATAGSLRAFVFRLPSVFIETNIRRVFIYSFFPQRERVSDREIYPLVEKTLDRRDPRRWYYALMDYGVYLKKIIDNPNRKSTGYRRQAPFEGSDRQLRGKVLRLLLSEGKMSYRRLIDKLDFPGAGEYERLAGILDGLEREGFIIKEETAPYEADVKNDVKTYAKNGSKTGEKEIGYSLKER